MLSFYGPQLDPNEKAYLLCEVNLTPVRLFKNSEERPVSFQGRHRWQLIWVNRNDRLAIHKTDLGPAANFKAEPFRIPSFWMHSIAQLQHIAERERLGDDYWQKRLAELASENTLITDFIDQCAEAQRVIANQSVFGPAIRRQRNGFPSRR